MSASFQQYQFSLIAGLIAQLLPHQPYLPGYAKIIRAIQKLPAPIKGTM